ncbi:hypothetical protein HPB47_000595 [Ixodes persulcatus]|uniref:Uncharacterized protein n=1 Tax=Ixodes persulcatus TaxID=34615 RepID=A0AC60PRK6_IXOPE|nr:hypothetical protein HPB47_000595 [Ixodes persulcatus]
MTSFSYLVPACLLAATLIGCVTSMETVLMADYLGVDAISLCWVGAGVVSLPLYLCSSTMLGRFRDSMGSYDNFYRLLAGIQLFVGLMFFLDTRLREAGAEAVYCLALGAPKGPNTPRAQLNHQGPFFPGHGLSHAQPGVGAPCVRVWWPTWLGSVVALLTKHLTPKV